MIRETYNYTPFDDMMPRWSWNSLKWSRVRWSTQQPLKRRYWLRRRYWLKMRSQVARVARTQKPSVQLGVFLERRPVLPLRLKIVE